MPALTLSRTDPLVCRGSRSQALEVWRRRGLAIWVRPHRPAVVIHTAGARHHEELSVPDWRWAEEDAK